MLTWKWNMVDKWKLPKYFVILFCLIPREICCPVLSWWNILHFLLILDTLFCRLLLSFGNWKQSLFDSIFTRMNFFQTHYTLSITFFGWRLVLVLFMMVYFTHSLISCIPCCIHFLNTIFSAIYGNMIQ